jgi:hypothetical protein
MRVHSVQYQILISPFTRKRKKGMTSGGGDNLWNKQDYESKYTMNFVSLQFIDEYTHRHKVHSN